MEITRNALFGKLNITLFKSIEAATVFCKLRGNPYVELAHWILHLLKNEKTDLFFIAQHYSIEVGLLESQLIEVIETLPKGASSVSDFSHQIIDSIEKSWLYATLTYNTTTIRSAILLAVLLQTPEFRVYIYGISLEFKKIPLTDLSNLLDHCIGSVEDNQDPPSLNNLQPGEYSHAVSTKDQTNPLTLYCTNLTELASSGKIDPVIGRSDEIRGMIDILLRRRQNNPLLTGEAGVGKTAVVEGLALAIAKKEVPSVLQNTQLFSLDLGAMLAGASMKGEFESRLKSLIHEVNKSKQDIILFIDEIHTLIGAGGAQGTGDAANLLKPALARGELRTIGATTWAEYKKHIEKDPALTRRFQILQVAEPNVPKAIEMIRGIIDMLESHHHVSILDEAVISAVKLSHRYIPSRQLPDKAISLLDTACARVAVQQNSVPAELDHLLRQKQAIELHQELLKRETKSLSRTHKPIMEELSQELSALNLKLETFQNNWANQKAILESLISKRKKLISLKDRQQLFTMRNEIHTFENPSYNENDPNIGINEQGSFSQEILELEREIINDQESLRKVEPLYVHEMVTTDIVSAVVSDWTGIPTGKMKQAEIDSVLKLQDSITQRVIGQDHAIAEITQRIQSSYAKVVDPNKPIGVFMLVGTSGVGKTETAMALADILYGGESSLITINMSEYQESHTVSTLKGAPPGYIGYGEGGVLTEAVRRRPYSVILLDEIEKAHSDVHEMFYQVFDKGWMEDSEGRFIDFKNTIILLTSNAASDILETVCSDESIIPEANELLETVMPHLFQSFPAAFLGRVTVIPYYPLTSWIHERIIKLQLNKIVERFRENHRIIMSYSDDLVSHIASKTSSSQIGARFISGYIEKYILPKLSLLWLNQLSKENSIDQILVSMKDDQISFDVIFKEKEA